MPFIKRWDIRNNKGELYPLTSHQFRATFVRELIKRKVPIAMIMKQYSHVSIEMTAHYLTLQEEGNLFRYDFKPRVKDCRA